MTQIRSPHVERLFRLLACLLSGKTYSVVELAERCQTSRRAIFRDIRLLQELDYPVAVDPVSQTCRLPDVGQAAGSHVLSAQEVAFLALAVELSPLRQTRALAMQLSAAVEKLLASFPAAQRQEIGRLLALCEVEGGVRRERREQSDLGEVLLAILYALRSGRTLRIGYREQDGTQLTTRLRPYRLLLASTGWQLAGLSGAHRKVVRMDVERICQAVPVDDFSTGGFSGQAAVTGSGVCPEPREG